MTIFEQLSELVKARRIFNKHERFLSFLYADKDEILLSHFKMTDAEKSNLIDAAKYLGGHVIVTKKTERVSRKMETTFYFNLRFIHEGVEFKMQIGHITKPKVSGFDALVLDWVSSVFLKEEGELGYHNGGMVKYAKKIGMTFEEKF